MGPRGQYAQALARHDGKRRRVGGVREKRCLYSGLLAGESRGHAALEGLHHAFQLPARETLHHFLHFHELLHQAIHVLDLHPGPGGDAPAA
jgi:hypothetical protein